MDEFFKKFLTKVCKDCVNKTQTGLEAMLYSLKLENGITEDIQIIFKPLGMIPRDSKEIYNICFSLDGKNAMESNGLKLESTILLIK
jgi:hypothetical protein